MLLSSKFVRGLALCALPAALSACGSDFVLPIGETNAEALFFSCDPDGLPGEVGEFQIITYENALGTVDPDSVEVRLTYVPEVSDMLTLTPASGSVIPLGPQTVTIEVTDCSFESADVRFLVDVIGRDLQTGELVTQSFSGTLPVTNQNVVVPPPPAPVVARQLAEAMTMSEFDQWPPAEQSVGNESFGAVLVDLDAEALSLAFDPTDGLLPIGDGRLGRVYGSEVDPLARSGRFVLLWSALSTDALSVEFVGDAFRGSVGFGAKNGLTSDFEGVASSWLRLVERAGAQVLLVPLPTNDDVGDLRLGWAAGPFGPIYSVELR
ncbi:MAG: hypothetical protein AAF196_17955 [Planctomycetota bacterium]